jgi:hypothetical protein
MAMKLLDNEAEALARKVIEMALSGDTTCLRVAFERLVPPRRDSPISLTLPKVQSVSDLGSLTQAILDAVGSGEITPSEAHALAGLVETHRRIAETVELEARVAALEQKGKQP